MAQTNTEAIRELEKYVAALVEQVDYLKDQTEKDDTERRDLTKNVATLLERVENLKIEIGRLEKQFEESERKRWNLTMVFVAALLSLLGGLIVALVRR